MLLFEHAPARPADPASFRDDLLALWDAAFGVACRIVRDRDTARDVIQEAACRALRYERGFEAGRPVRPWFLAIVRNVAIDEVRRPRHTDALPELVHHDATLDRLIARDECSEVLRQIARLRPAYRRALELKCRGHAYRDIADRLGIPIGTAQTFVHRAKLAVRAKMQ